MLPTVALAMLFLMISSSVFFVSRRAVQKTLPNETVAQPSFLKPPVFGGLTEPLAGVIPVSNKAAKQFAKDLVSAGDYRHDAVQNFLAKRNLGVLAVITCLLAIFAIGLMDGHELLLATAGIPFCVSAYSLPRLMLSSKAKRRTLQIEKAVPDAMDMIAMSIEGGLPIALAIRQIAEQLDNVFPTLASELKIVQRQSETGSVQSAFESFSQRINIPEVVAWSTMMRQSQKLGGQLAESLRGYATRIRIDRQNRAERMGNTASLKLLLPVVLCLAPPIGILLVGPAVIEFRDFINREKGNTTAAMEQFN